MMPAAQTLVKVSTIFSAFRGNLHQADSEKGHHFQALRATCLKLPQRRSKEERKYAIADDIEHNHSIPNIPSTSLWRVDPRMYSPTLEEQCEHGEDCPQEYSYTRVEAWFDH